MSFPMAVEDNTSTDEDDLPVGVCIFVAVTP